MKELISEVTEAFIDEMMNDVREYFIEEVIKKAIERGYKEANQRHEEAMKKRAIEFATNYVKPNLIEIDEVMTYFMIEKQYNEKYGSDE